MQSAKALDAGNGIEGYSCTERTVECVKRNMPYFNGLQPWADLPLYRAGTGRERQTTEPATAASANGQGMPS